ncbi:MULTISPECIES: FAD-dependent oxidoreductase [unclassified Bradyrhizobium]|uniref:FAD-dependent oxidoreductase n=1 Tax=unclassified Bradyrhizobium TaxID=2631580 RepID=UPI002479C4EE|nr:MULTISPECIES: FAD-dependent oxidoreductase [unclassified Bradyrhizobium]WGS22505.1 FAD-dependent oxidoreductase [Bradyrhizobium sp. ISRA463]WGS29484.1 FAD-dependent oxidoreductase [Bradyrhizobium sp. ISRA464]
MSERGQAFGIEQLEPSEDDLDSSGKAKSGSGPVVLPNFAFEPETEALAAAWAAAGTTMTRRRKCTFNRGIRRLKNFPVSDPVWPCLVHLGKAGPTLAASRINIKNPGMYDLTQVGNVTLVANTTVAASGGGYFRMTGLKCSSLPQTSHAAGVFSCSPGAVAGTSSEIGANDSTNGITVGIWNSATNTMAARCGGALVTAIGNTADWDGQFFNAVSRGNSDNFQAYRNGCLVADVASVSAALPAHEMYLLAANNNGTPSGSTRALSSWFVAGRNLTAAQMRELSAVLAMWHQVMSTAELDTYEAGYQPQNVTTYDAIVYGATAAGVLAARSLAREGHSVCIVGGWRDYNVGGVPGVGGLGWTDSTAPTAITGLPRYLINRTQTLAGDLGWAGGTAPTEFSGVARYLGKRIKTLLKGTSNISFEPRHFEQANRELLDPSFTGGADIPVYWSTGAVSAAVVDGQIAGFTTRDGRTFSGRVFIDCSYEMDLAYVSGCTMTVGREKAGAGAEAANGFRGVQTTYGSRPNQATNHSGAAVDIDPWNTPGDTNSGLIAGVQGVFANGTPANGSADGKVQSMAYRLTLTTTPAYMIPFPSTPPAGYSKSKYEILLRLFAADPTLVLTDIFNIQPLAADVFDFNTKNIMSSDFVDPTSTEYATASYARREEIIQLHKSYIFGLWYLLQHEEDSRVPAAIRASALTYGLSAKHYVSPNWGDQPNFNSQIYVRSGRRIVGDYVLTAEDLNAPDGTTPRSTKTIAVAAYDMDSHAIEYRAYFDGTSWKVIIEGNLYITPTSGADKKAPIPYEYMLPRRGDPSNLLCLFGGSATNVAISEIRMEPPFWQMGQSAGVAAALAIENGDNNVKNLAANYPRLRARLLEVKPLLSGETTLSLPMVN